MSRIAYVNGLYLSHLEAAVHIDDRGFQFSDGVYEVISVNSGKLVDLDLHLHRLEYSLNQLNIDMPISGGSLVIVINEVLRRNHVKSGIIYLQITRGQAQRNHSYPKGLKPTLVITARHFSLSPKTLREKGVSVITTTDLRWKRCDIKSISLLPNILAKQLAVENNAFEAWLVNEEGVITEGSSSNAWILGDNNNLITHKLDQSILSGVTRTTIINLCNRLNIKVDESTFTVDDAKKSREAFVTSSTAFILPVVSIDGSLIGDGKPGPVFQKLDSEYRNYLSN